MKTNQLIGAVIFAFLVIFALGFNGIQTRNNKEDMESMRMAITRLENNISVDVSIARECEGGYYYLTDTMPVNEVLSALLEKLKLELIVRPETMRYHTGKNIITVEEKKD